MEKFYFLFLDLFLLVELFSNLLSVAYITNRGKSQCMQTFILLHKLKLPVYLN